MIRKKKKLMKINDKKKGEKISCSYVYHYKFMQIIQKQKNINNK